MQLGPYHLTERLGRGGMGEVHAAVHTPTGVDVAIKLVRPGDRGSADAFLHEARAIAGLQHPNIVQLLDLGRCETRVGPWQAGSPYLVMERADGSLVGHAGRLPWPALRATLLALLDALGHAHAHGLVHCDLKPGNVLIGGRRPGPRLADFGLARALRFGDAASPGVSGGTAAYMAPEQARRRSRELGPWTDLYALGALAWTMCTGDPVFSGSSAREVVSRHLLDEPGPLVPCVPVPEGFEGWVRLLLQKSPDDRFVRAADAAYALTHLPDAAEGAGPLGTRDLAPLTFVFPATSMAWLDEAPPPTHHTVRADPPPLPRRWPARPPPRLPPDLVGVGLGLLGLRQASLVDRDAERRALWEALLDVAEARQPRVVWIEGATGLGKSRLAEALATSAHEVGAANVVRATYGPRTGPGDGVEPMLLRALRCEGLAGEDLRDALDLAMHARAVTDPAEQQLVHAVLGEGGAGLPERTRDAVAVRLFRALAQERPLVVWLDDAQWGAGGLRVVRRVCDAADLAALVLVTVATDGLDGAGGDPALEGVREHEATTVLDVGPIPAEDRLELVDAVLHLEPTLAERVAARTAGHPLFVEQIVTGWAERGRLHQTPAGFALSDDRGTAAQAGWGQRLAGLLQQLPAGGAEALEVAAVLGTERLGPVWERCIAGTCDPAPVTSALLDAGLARWHPSTATWSWTHGSMRDEMVSRARDAGRLGSHHLACGAVLRDAGELGDAGLHLLEGGDAAGAVDLLLAGAQSAREAARTERALRLQRLLATALDAAGCAAGDPRRGELQREALYALRIGSSRQAEVAAARSLIDAARCHGWLELEAVGLRRLAQALRDDGRVGEAVTIAREAVDKATAASAPLERVWSLHRLASTLDVLGRTDEAYPLARLAAEEAEALRHGHAAGMAWSRVASILGRRGELDAARRLVRRALGHLDGGGQRAARADVLADLGDLERSSGRLREAAAAYREAASLFALGDPVPQACMEGMLGLVRLEEGAYADAAQIFDQGIAALRDAFPSVANSLQICAAASRAAMGQWDLAEAVFSEGEAGLAENPEIDADVALGAGMLVDHALRAGHVALARRAAALGAVHLEGLGRHDEATTLRASAGLPKG